MSWWPISGCCMCVLTLPPSILSLSLSLRQRNIQIENLTVNCFALSLGMISCRFTVIGVSGDDGQPPCDTLPMISRAQYQSKYLPFYLFAEWFIESINCVTGRVFLRNSPCWKRRAKDTVFSGQCEHNSVHTGTVKHWHIWYFALYINQKNGSFFSLSSSVK